MTWLGRELCVARRSVTLASVFTLGFVVPWGKASLERYKMRHTAYGDLQAVSRNRLVAVQADLVAVDSALISLSSS